MPKENSKKGKRKKTSNDGDGEAPKEKKPKPAKKPKKLRIEDEIGMSKQLSQKLRTSTRGASKNSKHPESRISANGKPMPSLAELERMFEGSDEEDTTVAPAAPPSPERCKTPEQPIVPDPKKLLTPKTIQEISNKMLKLISTLPDTSAIADDAPPLPVVPQEPKRKKNGEAYIVGCKERDKIPDAPSSAVIGRAWDKYGIDYKFKRDEDDSEPSKRSKGCGSLSKSIFNPKSEEIASMLESAEILSDGSVDSNKTLPYEYSALSPNSKQRTFSPLPSTSKDNETFLKNDLRFNESLLGDNVSNHSSLSEVEVIELPCETIMVDDDGPDVDTASSQYVKVTKPEVEEVRYHAPTFDSFLEDDMYSSIVIDLDETYDKDDCQIIDVDEVLAENKNIIDKYKKESYTNSVTHVRSGTSKEPNRLQPKEEPIIVDEYQHNEHMNNMISTRDHIESIVTNYFKQQPPNSTGPDQVHHTETIDLSESCSEPSMFRNMLDSLLNCTKSLMDTWSNKATTSASNRRLPNVPVVLDTIDLDLSNLNDNSIQIVENRTIGIHGNQSSNLRNTPNDNSVIIVGNVNVNSTNVAKNKKPRKSKKSTVVPDPAVQSPVGAETPPGRTIGDCPICMDNLSNNAIASTICGHIFCMGCIQAAVKASGKRCPTCRKVLKGVGYHQLFL